MGIKQNTLVTAERQRSSVTKESFGCKNISINRQAPAGTEKDTQEKRTRQKLRDNVLRLSMDPAPHMVDKLLSRSQFPQSEQGTLGSVMHLLSASAQALATGGLLLTDPSVLDQWPPKGLQGPTGVEQQGC